MTQLLEKEKTLMIDTLWDSQSEQDWQAALNLYWSKVRPANVTLEQTMQDLHQVTHPTQIPDWYSFLHDEYFRWKYTDGRRYAQTTKHFRKTYDADRPLLHRVIANLFHHLQHRPHDIDACLKAATSPGSGGSGIKGLGVAGASGLLSLLKPTHFGTVDQFVVLSLRKIPGLPERHQLLAMNENGLKLEDGSLLTRILRRKAAELNQRFRTDAWTPRKIEMILWAFR